MEIKGTGIAALVTQTVEGRVKETAKADGAAAKTGMIGMEAWVGMGVVGWLLV